MFSNLTFQFVPVAHIRDRRFAYLFLFLVSAAFTVYGLATFLLHKDSDFSSPASVDTIWIASTRSPLTDSPNTSPPFYCNNASYDFRIPMRYAKLTPNLSATNISCKWFGDGIVTSYAEDSLQIATIVQLLDNDFTGAEAYFTTQVEQVRVNMLFSIALPDGGGMARPSTVVVRDKNSDVYKEFVGPVTLTIPEILALTGSSMDDENPEEGRYRFTGMHITVTKHFSNLQDWSFRGSLTCDLSFKVVPHMWGNMNLAMVSGQNAYRRGIMLMFTARGQIGVFSWSTLITRLLASYITVGICRSFVTKLIQLLAFMNGEGFRVSHRLEVPSRYFRVERWWSSPDDDRDEDDDNGGQERNATSNKDKFRRAHRKSFFVPSQLEE